MASNVKLLPLPAVEAIDNLLSASEQEIKEYAGRAGVSRFPPPETLRGWARAIASARLAIRTALEAAREDAARLDWLDAQCGDDVRGSFPDDLVLVGHYWTVSGQCHDVREAIDAARKEVGGE